MRPLRRSSRGSPTWARARSAAVMRGIEAWPPNTPRTRSRMALSKDRSRVLACSSLTLTTSDSTSASSSGPSPWVRSSCGRSPGSTQTSGRSPWSLPSSMSSLATAPSDRSRTVTCEPLASRAAPIMVTVADQPASVPPATSTRVDTLGNGHRVPLVLGLERLAAVPPFLVRAARARRGRPPGDGGAPPHGARNARSPRPSGYAATFRPATWTSR